MSSLFLPEFSQKERTRAREASPNAQSETTKIIDSTIASLGFWGLKNENLGGLKVADLFMVVGSSALALYGVNLGPRPSLESDHRPNDVDLLVPNFLIAGPLNEGKTPSGLSITGSIEPKAPFQKKSIFFHIEPDPNSANLPVELITNPFLRSIEKDLKRFRRFIQKNTQKRQIGEETIRVASLHFLIQNLSQLARLERGFRINDSSDDLSSIKKFLS